MIKIFLMIVLSAAAVWFIVGRKIAKNMRTASDRKFEREQEKAAFNEGYQAEKKKIAAELGKQAARDEQEGKKAVYFKTEKIK